MSLFKYFEERAKDGLTGLNGPLSSCVPADASKHWPTKRYLGAHGVSAELAQHLKKRNVFHTIGR